MRKGEAIYLRGKTWYLDARINGRRYVVKLGKGITRSVAWEIAQVKRGAILKGDAGIGRKRKDVLFDVARHRFEEWADLNTRPRTAKSYKECLRRLAESFSGKWLSEIVPLDVERHKHKRVKAGARVRPNREVTLLTQLYTKAKQWGLYEGEDPTTNVKHLEEPKRRLRVLDLEEEAALLAESPEPYRSLFLVCLNTGVRMESEGITLEWPDLDARLSSLTVRDCFAKNHKPRSIPINSRAREVLLSLKASACGPRVFAKRNGQPLKNGQHVFKAACIRAGLLDCVPHTLRHTWASRLVEAGCDLRMLMELGGWSSLLMVERYSHVNPKRKAEAVEKLVTIPIMVHNRLQTASVVAVEKLHGTV